MKFFLDFNKRRNRIFKPKILVKTEIETLFLVKSRQIFNFSVF